MLNLTNSEIKDIELFCELNEIKVEEFVKECFSKGYQIEKYGLLTIDGQTVIEKEVIKEVIKEVPVEVIKEVVKEVEVEVIKEIIVEKPVEVIKEVIIEKPIEVIKEVIIEKPIEVIKEVYITDDNKIEELIKKIEVLENRPPEIVEKEIVKEIEVEVETIKEIIKEVEVVKEVENKDKLNKLQDTIQSLRDDITKKEDKILHLEENLLELKKIQGPTRAQYMSSSNLNDNLYR